MDTRCTRSPCSLTVNKKDQKNSCCDIFSAHDGRTVLKETLNWDTFQSVNICFLIISLSVNCMIIKRKVWIREDKFNTLPNYKTFAEIHGIIAVQMIFCVCENGRKG